MIRDRRPDPGPYQVSLSKNDPEDQEAANHHGPKMDNFKRGGAGAHFSSHPFEQFVQKEKSNAKTKTEQEEGPRSKRFLTEFPPIFSPDTRERYGGYDPYDDQEVEIPQDPESSGLVDFSRGGQLEADGRWCVKKIKYVEVVERSQIQDCHTLNVTQCHDTYLTHFEHHMEQVRERETESNLFYAKNKKIVTKGFFKNIARKKD